MAGDMTHKALARQVCVDLHIDPDWPLYEGPGKPATNAAVIERAIAEAVAAETERCAQEALRYGCRDLKCQQCVGNQIAHDIRHRKDPSNG